MFQADAISIVEKGVQPLIEELEKIHEKLLVDVTHSLHLFVGPLMPHGADFMGALCLFVDILTPWTRDKYQGNGTKICWKVCATIC